MTDEEKKVDEKKVCKCSELGSFFTQVAAIFLGVLLAILVSAAVLKPQCPCHKGMSLMGRPGFSRQLPYPPMGAHFRHGGFGAEYHGVPKFDKSQFKSHGHNFQPPVKPQNNK